MEGVSQSRAMSCVTLHRDAAQVTQCAFDASSTGLRMRQRLFYPPGFLLDISELDEFLVASEAGHRPSSVGAVLSTRRSPVRCSRFSEVRQEGKRSEVPRRACPTKTHKRPRMHRRARARHVYRRPVYSPAMGHL